MTARLRFSVCWPSAAPTRTHDASSTVESAVTVWFSVSSTSAAVTMLASHDAGLIAVVAFVVAVVVSMLMSAFVVFVVVWAPFAAV